MVCLDGGIGMGKAKYSIVISEDALVYEVSATGEATGIAPEEE